MADFTTKDGKEITFDFYTFSNAEFFEIFKSDDFNKASGMLVAKVVGMSYEDFEKMDFPDNQGIRQKFLETCRNIQTDPNWASAST